MVKSRAYGEKLKRSRREYRFCDVITLMINIKKLKSVITIYDWSWFSSQDRNPPQTGLVRCGPSESMDEWTFGRTYPNGSINQN